MKKLTTFQNDQQLECIYLATNLSKTEFNFDAQLEKFVWTQMSFGKEMEKLVSTFLTWEKQFRSVNILAKFKLR